MQRIYNKTFTFAFEMRTLSYLLIFLFSIYTAQAQRLTWSLPMESSSKTQYSDILLKKNGFSLIHSRNPDLSEKLIVENYNDSMQLVSQVKLLPSKKEGNVIAYFENNGDYWIFRTVYSLLEGCNILYLDQYKYGETQPFQGRELCKTPLKNYGDKGDFLVTRSMSRGYFLCYFTTVDDNGNDLVNLLLLDSAGNKVYNRILPQVYHALDAELIQLECDDVQNAYILFSENESNNKTDPNALMYKLAIYDHQESKLFLSVIDSGKSNITDLYLSLNTKEQYAVMNGFYKLPKVVGLAGIADIRVSIPQGNMIHAAYHQFSDEYRMKALGEKQYNNNPSLRDYVVRNQFLKPDGSSVLISERVYTSQQNYSYMSFGTMQTSYRTVYNFNEIGIFVFNADGSLKWQQAIRKSQSTINDGGINSGFSWCVCNDRVLFHFNKSSKTGVSIAEYELLENGDLLERDLFGSDNKDYLMIPGECKQIATSEMLFTLTKDNNKFLLKAKYPF